MVFFSVPISAEMGKVKNNTCGVTSYSWAPHRLTDLGALWSASVQSLLRGVNEARGMRWGKERLPEREAFVAFAACVPFPLSIKKSLLGFSWDCIDSVHQFREK